MKILPSCGSPIPIVHLITSLHVGGAQMHLYKTLSRFNKKHFTSTVISMVEPGKVGQMLAKEGIEVLTLGMTKGRPTLTGFLKLWRLLKRLKPRFLQTHLYHADLLGFLAGKSMRVPNLFWNIRQSQMDFLHYQRSTAMTVNLCARLSRQVDKILVNSHAGLKEHAQLGYDRSKMLVIPNGFEVHRFRPDRVGYLKVREELGVAPDTRLIGMVARFDPQKDHGNFLHAAKLVSERAPHTRFLLAGHGLQTDNLELLSLVKSSGLNPHRLFLLGERADIPRLMAALDVFVSSSAFGEGFANAIGEAMSCGVPCVVTNVGDSALIVGDTGLVVPPQDPTKLAQGIFDLLHLKPADYQQRSVGARQRLKEEFAIEKIVNRLESCYREPSLN